MKNIALDKAKSVLAKRRNDALLRCEQTLAKLDSHLDWFNCQQQIRTARMNLGLVLGTAKEQQYREPLDKLLEKEKHLLEKYGYTPADLAPKFYCTTCNDTGFANGKKCKCLTAELTKIWFDDCDIDPNKCFATSTETDAKNLVVYKFCQELSKKWPNTNICNVVLSGKTGTGKSYLCNAMACEFAKNGYNVLSMTAYQLNNAFLQYHLADFAQKGVIMDNLTDVDVLVIDDLGTENVLKNVTMEYLYLLVNERCLNSKVTIVSTNLNLSELRSRYEDRILHRLTDKSKAIVAQLVGKDKRSQTK